MNPNFSSSHHLVILHCMPNANTIIALAWFQDAPKTSFAKMFLWMTDKVNNDELRYFVTLAWATWTCRNKELFKVSPRSPHTLSGWLLQACGRHSCILKEDKWLVAASLSHTLCYGVEETRLWLGKSQSRCLCGCEWSCGTWSQYRRLTRNFVGDSNNSNECSVGCSYS